MNKEVRQLLREVRRSGCSVVQSKGSHVKVYRGSRLLVVIAATPSDHRSLLNTRAQLRRAGAL